VATRHTHTAIVARDVDRLVDFYISVLGCAPSGPNRDLSGEPLERGMGLPGAHVRGTHLRLPGYRGDGPVLEIFALDETVPSPADVNRLGLMHIAFAVDDIEDVLARTLAAGGSAVGEVATVEVGGVGTAQFVYTRDPEGNIVELQSWLRTTATLTTTDGLR
jgi:glyoxylase I family protein